MSEYLSIDDLEKDIKKIASRVSFIRSAHIFHKGRHTIKLRLNITEECFVQIYQNIKKNLINYVAVLGTERIYGRDCDGGIWHRHPKGNPEGHDFSKEGSKTVELETFLFEVQELLVEMKIL